MLDQRRGQFILRRDERVLCVDLVDSAPAPGLKEQLLLSDAAFIQLNADFLDLITDLRLLKVTPGLPHIELNQIGCFFQGSHRPGIIDECASVGIALGFSIKKRIDAEADAGFGAVEINALEPVLAVAARPALRHKGRVGLQGICGNQELAFGIFDAIAGDHQIKS